MASYHLLRQISQLPGKLGKCGQFSLARSTLASTQITPGSLSKSICQKHTLAPILTQKSTSKFVPQLSAVRRIATSQPRASATGDHVRLWQAERIVSVALIGLMPACLIAENAFVDGALALLMVMHSHWGLEAIILDYARPIVVGNILPKVAFLSLHLLSAITLGGLFYLIFNGQGMAKFVKQFWSALSEQKTVKH